MSQFRIVFRGRTLPGHDTEAARKRLAKALGAGPELADRLFSGAKVSLKSGLDAAQAERFQRKLAAIGIEVTVEPLPPKPPLPPATPAPTTTVAAVPAAEPGSTFATADSMSCPKCGHRQARRTLCLACGVDMPRFAANRDHAPVETPAREQAGRVALSAAILAGAEQRDPCPPLLGLGLGGRMGRLAYITGFLLLTCVTFWGVMTAVAFGFTFLAGLLLVAVVIPYLRLHVMRCHDLDWSGWWVLLSAVPVVGTIFSLVLLAIRGTPDDNRFGPPVESAGWGRLLVALGAHVGLAVVVLPLTQDRMRAGIERRLADASDAGARALLGTYSPASDEIFLFTRRDCAPCDRRRDEFDRLGVRYIELYLDDDAELARLLASRLALSERPGSRGLPMVEINGTLLAGDPPLARIANHFGTR
ncbi:MAG: DUF805 domain-containing protein [Rhodocyclaceae bacterium]|nr:DUF805 domain-containing protein [Rhodocyclaceae bacterium]